jgi:Rod binding domain-containing protein
MTAGHVMEATSTLSPRTVAAARDAAQKFEAHALGALLQPMFETLSARHAFGGGAAEEMWRPMLVAEFGKVMAASGGIGLADSVLRQMLARQEAAQAEAGRAEAGRAEAGRAEAGQP